jgi:hypothetical protein
MTYAWHLFIGDYFKTTLKDVSTFDKYHIS